MRIMTGLEVRRLSGLERMEGKEWGQRMWTSMACCGCSDGDSACGSKSSWENEDASVIAPSQSDSARFKRAQFLVLHF